jgi:hypothetical protein
MNLINFFVFDRSTHIIINMSQHNRMDSFKIYLLNITIHTRVEEIINDKYVINSLYHTALLLSSTDNFYTIFYRVFRDRPT